MGLVAWQHVESSPIKDKIHVACIQRWILNHLTTRKALLAILRWENYAVLCAGAGAAPAKSFQSCLTLRDPIDGSPPGFPVPGILQARTLEWVAISFSNAWKWKVKVKSLSCLTLMTLWTAAYQAPLSMGFARQEYWSALWWAQYNPKGPYEREAGGLKLLVGDMIVEGRSWSDARKGSWAKGCGWCLKTGKGKEIDSCGKSPEGIQPGQHLDLRLLISRTVSLSVQLFANPWTAAQHASLSFISRSLLKLMSIESVMPSNHLILCHPLLLLPSVFPSIRVFSNESILCITWPKYWSFSFSISPSNEYSGLISFRIDWFNLLGV